MNYASSLKRKYKISVDKRDTLKDKQGGVCAICAQPGKSLCVDHNHTTGEVRGLLCSNCNTGLGLFGDNVQHLTQAIEYLRLTHSASPVR